MKDGKVKLIINGKTLLDVETTPMSSEQLQTIRTVLVTLILSGAGVGALAFVGAPALFAAVPAIILLLAREI